MRVLLIPVEKPGVEVKTGDWNSAIYYLLSRKHTVVGIVRPCWHTLVGRRRYFVLAWYWLKALVDGLFRGDYDIVYAMNTPSSVIGMVVSLLRQKPLVWDAGNPALFNPGKLQRIMWLMERIIARRAKRIRMISVPYARAYLDRGVGIGKMVIIPHLVNLNNIDAALEQSAPIDTYGDGYIMFMGQGNTPSNVAAIRFLNDMVAPAISKRIVVTGGRAVGGCNRVTFAGYVPNIYEYIRSCDFAVVPVWRDTKDAPVPTTRVVDFMACGKAVVTTPFLYDELPELSDGTNIYLAEDGAEFIAKVQYVLEHLGETGEVGQRARKLIEERYTWDIAEERLQYLLT